MANVCLCGKGGRLQPKPFMRLFFNTKVLTQTFCIQTDSQECIAVRCIFAIHDQININMMAVCGKSTEKMGKIIVDQIETIYENIGIFIDM